MAAYKTNATNPTVRTTSVTSPTATANIYVVAERMFAFEQLDMMPKNGSKEPKIGRTCSTDIVA
jgi:hypothetical protein